MTIYAHKQLDLNYDENHSDKCRFSNRIIVHVHRDSNFFSVNMFNNFSITIEFWKKKIWKENSDP